MTLYLSTDGSGAVPIEALKQVLERGGQVIIAFDADRAGEELAWRIAQQLPGVRQVTPAYGKDWNERLVHNGHPERASQPQQDQEMWCRREAGCLWASLWQWHQVARDLDKSEGYLSRITEVAREFNRGEPLSDRAKAAMQRDFQDAQRQRQIGTSLKALETPQGNYGKCNVIEIGN